MGRRNKQRRRQPDVMYVLTQGRFSYRISRLEPYWKIERWRYTRARSGDLLHGRVPTHVSRVQHQVKHPGDTIETVWERYVEARCANDPTFREIVQQGVTFTPNDPGGDIRDEVRETPQAQVVRTRVTLNPSSVEQVPIRNFVPPVIEWVTATSGTSVQRNPSTNR